jgi:hypothetical protein
MSPVPGHPAGTRGLADAAFVAAFEDCTLPNERFRHWDHLRFAFLALREDGAGAADRVAAAIRRFAAHHAAPHKYHDTLTRAYVHFVAVHAARTPALTDFDAFAAAHPALFDRALPLHFWSEAALWSDAARGAWLPPDLRPLPSIPPAAR